MKTDVNKLHEAIKLRNKLGINNFPYQCGKTTLLCHELTGIIEVENFKMIVVGIFNFYSLDFILPMLFDIFNEHELKYKYMKQQEKIICGDKVIRFILIDELEKRTRGFRDYYYLEMK